MDENQESLITDEHRAMLGKWTEPKRHVLNPVDVAKVRAVLEDHDPRYAAESGLAGPYALSILEPRPTMDLPRDMVPRVFPMAVLTQTEWTVHRPFKVGEEILARHAVVDLRERLGGRFGRSILLLTQTEFRAADGELIAETLHTITQYDPKGGSAR